MLRSPKFNRALDLHFARKNFHSSSKLHNKNCFDSTHQQRLLIFTMTLNNSATLRKFLIRACCVAKYEQGEGKLQGAEKKIVQKLWRTLCTAHFDTKHKQKLTSSLIDVAQFKIDIISARELVNFFNF